MFVSKGEPIILESSTKDVEVDIGGKFDLDCKAQGYPKPNISWIRADSKALHDGSAKFNGEILKLRNIRISDRGVYKCIATNLIGNGAQWTLKLSVRCNFVVFMLISLTKVFIIFVKSSSVCQLSRVSWPSAKL